MKISKTIKQLDEEFAREAGLNYAQYKELTLLEQSKIRKGITNKSLKQK